LWVKHLLCWLDEVYLIVRVDLIGKEGTNHIEHREKMHAVFLKMLAMGGLAIGGVAQTVNVSLLVEVGMGCGTVLPGNGDPGSQHYLHRHSLVLSMTGIVALGLGMGHARVVLVQQRSRQEFPAPIAAVAGVDVGSRSVLEAAEANVSVVTGMEIVFGECEGAVGVRRERYGRVQQEAAFA
jgi:hypothetical protein